MTLMKGRLLRCVNREKALLGTSRVSLLQKVPADDLEAGEAEPQSSGSAGPAAAGAAWPGPW